MLIAISLLLGLGSCLRKDFAWGVATAAYQIEGGANIDGRGPSIWDDYCKLPGTINNNDNGDVADDFYHKYKEDIAMMKSLGIKNFRMSFSWSRILPQGTSDKGVNGLGVNYYNSVINELLAAGITPWVTLHHWDTPSALHNNTDTGSFLSKDMVENFNNYADFCFAVFGDRVKHWITLNEPWTYTWIGYGVGAFAPGRCSPGVCRQLGGGGNTATEPYIVTHNMILSHAKAVQTYRTKQYLKRYNLMSFIFYQQAQGGVIGMANNIDFTIPFDINDQTDIAASNRQHAFQLGWYVDPIVFGKYPDEMTALVTDGRLPTFTSDEVQMIKGSYDFIGFNHYTTNYIKNKDGPGGDWSQDCRTETSYTNASGNAIGPKAESQWLNVYPEGIRGVLNWVSKRYGHPVIYLFENGVSVPGETQLPFFSNNFEQKGNSWLITLLQDCKLRLILPVWLQHGQVGSQQYFYLKAGRLRFHSQIIKNSLQRPLQEGNFSFHLHLYNQSAYNDYVLQNKFSIRIHSSQLLQQLFDGQPSITSNYIYQEHRFLYHTNQSELATKTY